MKKLSLILTSLLLGVVSLLFFGCGDKYADVSVDFSGIESSYTMGTNANDEFSFYVNVNNLDNASIEVSSDNDNISVASKTKLSDGRTQVVIKALNPGYATLTAKTLEGDKSVSKKILIIQPLTDFSVSTDNNLALVKGSSFTVNIEELFDLYPLNANNIDFAIEESAYVAGVSYNSSNKTITVSSVAESGTFILTFSHKMPDDTYLSKTISFEVLDRITADNIVYTFSNTYNDSPVIVANSVNSNFATLGVTIRVYTDKSIDFSPVRNSIFSCVPSSSVVSGTDEDGKAYKQIEYTVSYTTNVSSVTAGSYVKQYFNVLYSGYTVVGKIGANNASVADDSCLLANILCEFEARTITLNGVELTNTASDSVYSIFTEYDSIKKGFLFVINSIPQNLSSISFKVSGDNIGGLKFYRSNNLSTAISAVDGYITLSAGATYYVKVGDTLTNNQNVVLNLESNTNAITGAKVEAKLTLCVKTGVESIDGTEAQKNYYIQLNSSSSAANVINLVYNTGKAPADVSAFDIIAPACVSIAKSVYIEGSTNYLKLELTGLSVGEGKIIVKSNNSNATFSITIKVYNSAYSSDNTLYYSTPSSGENSGVAQRVIESGSVSKIVAKQGSKVNIFSYTVPTGAYVSYAYASNNDTIVNVDENGELNFISAGESTITITATIYYGSGIAVSTQIKTYSFIAVCYVPISSVTTSSNSATLYTLDTVGYYNQSLAMTNFGLNIVYQDGTKESSADLGLLKKISDIVSGNGVDRTGVYVSGVDYDTSVFDISVVGNKIHITAKQSNYETTYYLRISIVEYNITYNISFKIIIKNAVNVETIDVSNANTYYSIDRLDRDSSEVNKKEVYFNLLDYVVGGSYIINATAYSTTAFNRSLIYELVNLDGEVVDTLSGNILYLSSNMSSFCGWIRISAKDAYKLVDGQRVLTSNEKGNVVYIPLRLVDGLTIDSAIQITNGEAMKSYMTYDDASNKYNSTYFFKLMKSITVDYSIGIIGGIDGNNYNITINNAPFVDTLPQNGVLKDLNIILANTVTLSSSAVVAKTNNGTIENVFVSGSASLTNSASFVYENYGTITGSISEVKITVTGTVAGFVYNNYGTVEDSVFMGSTATETAINGFAYSNASAAKIEGCMVLICKDKTLALIESKEFISSNSGTISACIVYSYTSSTYVLEIDNTYNTAPSATGYDLPENNGSEYVYVSSTQAVLYYYLPTEALTDADAIAKLDEINTFNVLGDSRFYRITLAQNDALTVDGGKLIINDITSGVVEMTVTSKLSGEETTIYLYVIYPIVSIDVYDANSPQDKATLVNDDEEISLKREYVKSLFVCTDQGAYHVFNNVGVKYTTNDDLKVDTAFATKTNLGVVSISYTSSGDKTLTVNLNAANLTISTDAKTKISELFAKTYNVNVYNGAESIKTDISSQQLEPVNSFVFYVTILTDKTPVSGQNAIKLTIYKKITNADGTYSVEDISEQELANFNENYIVSTSAVPTDASSDTYVTYIYKVVMSIKNKLAFSEATDYVVRVEPNEQPEGLKADIELTILPQNIISVTEEHYYTDAVNVEDNVAYLTTSSDTKTTLAPGKEGVIKVAIYPYYANINYIEFECEGINNANISLSPLTFYQNCGYLDAAYSYQIVDGKIRIYIATNGVVTDSRLNKLFGDDYDSSEVVYLYIKTLAPTNIDEDTTFKITTTVKMVNDDYSNYQKDIYLTAKYLAEPVITFDGSDYDVAGRGTWNNFEIAVYNSTNDIDVEIVNKTDTSSTIYNSIYIELDKESYEEVKLSESTYVRYYSGRYYVGVNYGKDASGSSFEIRVATKTVLDGSEERRYDYGKVYVDDFAIESLTITDSINNASSIPVLTVDIGTKITLNYTLSIATIEPYNNNDSNESSAIASYKNSVSSKIVEFLAKSGNISLYASGSLLMFDENNQNSSFGSVIFDYSAEFKSVSITGVSEGTINMMYQIDLGHENVPPQQFNFIITSQIKQSEDKPVRIYTKDDFLNIFTQTTAQNYILMNDLTFDNFEIISSTSLISSLDGNNKVITINSFSYSVTSSLVNLALFNTISEGTTIKNLTINYGTLNSIDFNNSIALTELNVAGLAIENRGILANIQVLSFTLGGGIKISGVTSAVDSSVAGLVIKNEGYITNSRVGLVGNKFTQVSAKYAYSGTEAIDLTSLSSTKTTYSFNIEGFGKVAGFVIENSSTISSSYFAGDITNKSSNQQSGITSGFVINNMQGARITCSEASASGEIDENGYATGTGITTNGIAAGFVYSNVGTISDCLTRINFADSAKFVAGFVYSQAGSGVISTCVSICNMQKNATTYNYFSGVNSNLDDLISGTVEYSYYYSPDQYEQSYNVGAGMFSYMYNTNANDETAIKATSTLDYLLSGLCFASTTSDGVWTLDDNYQLQLISANEIAISCRVSQNIKQNNVEDYVMHYLSGYKYGSSVNPIIIRSASEFVSVMSSSTDTDIKATYNAIDGEIYGSYRIVCDLDFDTLAKNTSGTQRLATSIMSLTKNNSGMIGQIDGNSMTITNIDIALETTNTGSSSSAINSFGLFGSVKNYATIKNLNLEVINVTSQYTSCVGTVTGYAENARIVNINISAKNETSTVTGLNFVGGAIGWITGDSVASNITTNLSVTASAITDSTPLTFSSSSMLGSLQSGISYAGGVVGIIDITSGLTTNTYTGLASRLVASGDITIKGMIAGGVAGYVGSNATLEYSSFLLTSLLSTAKITSANYSGYLGGVVGHLAGTLYKCTIENSAIQNYNDMTTYDKYAETMVSNYYSRGGSKYIYEGLFDSGTPYAIGGIAGYVFGLDAKINNSYAKIGVVNTGAQVVGGIVGLNAGKVVLSQVYMFGNVKGSQATGTCAGAGIGSMSTGATATFDAVNMLTYYDRTGATILVIVGSGTTPIYTNTYYVNNLAKSALNISLGQNGIALLDLFPATGNTANISLVFTPGIWDQSVWVRDTNYTLLDFITSFTLPQIFEIRQDSLALDLLNMSRYPNAEFTIMEDINLSSVASVVSIAQGLSNSTFTGSLHAAETSEDIGEYYIISGLSYTLLGKVSGAHIYNLNIKNSEVTNGNAVLARSSTNAVFENVTFNNCVLATRDKSYPSVAILSAEDSNSLFAGIEINSCNICMTATNTENVGYVVGKESKVLTLDDLKIFGGTITAQAINAGLIAGYVGGSVNCLTEEDSIYLKNELKIGDTLSPTLTVSSATGNLFVGGLFGLVISSANVYGTVNTTGDTTTYINATVEVSSATGNVNYGGIAGKVGTLTVINTNVNITANLGSTDNNISASSKTTKLGGLAGQASSLFVNKKDNSDTGTVLVDGEITVYSAGETYLGGLAGEVTAQAQVANFVNNTVLTSTQANNTTIYAGGVFGLVTEGATRVNISHTKIAGDIIINKSTNLLIYAGGMIGIMNSAVIISDSYAWGDIWVKNDTTVSQLRLGGLIGSGESYKKATLTSNYVLTSLKNASYVNDKNNTLTAISAISNVTYNPSSINNYYCYEISLATDNIAYTTNYWYHNAQSKKAILTEIDENLVEYKKNTYKNNSKIHPSPYNDETTIEEYTYYYVLGAKSISLSDNITISKGSALIGDGILSIELGEKNITVEENAIVAGIKTTVNQDQSFDRNDGYLCGVIMTGTGGHLVGANVSDNNNGNYGLVKYCVADIEEAVSGILVGTNNGLIDTCYSAGSVSSGKGLYCLADTGFIANSYTIAKGSNVWDGDDSSVIINSLYDTDSTECGKEVSIKPSFAGETDSSVPNACFSRLGGRSATEQAKYNYGYPTLTGGALGLLCGTTGSYLVNSTYSEIITVTDTSAQQYNEVYNGFFIIHNYINMKDTMTHCYKVNSYKMLAYINSIGTNDKILNNLYNTEYKVFYYDYYYSSLRTDIYQYTIMHNINYNNQTCNIVLGGETNTNKANIVGRDIGDDNKISITLNNALFEKMTKGLISNLSLIITPNTSNGTITEISYVGGIVGYMSGGTISNCTSNGTIAATSSSNVYVGGIVGYMSGGTISNCTNNAIVKSTLVTNILSDQKCAYAAGICGYVDNNSVTINSSTNSGSISAKVWVAKYNNVFYPYKTENFLSTNSPDNYNYIKTKLPNTSFTKLYAAEAYDNNDTIIFINYDSYEIFAVYAQDFFNTADHSTTSTTNCSSQKICITSFQFMAYTETDSVSDSRTTSGYFKAIWGSSSSEGMGITSVSSYEIADWKGLWTKQDDLTFKHDGKKFVMFSDTLGNDAYSFIGSLLDHKTDKELEYNQANIECQWTILIETI